MGSDDEFTIATEPQHNYGKTVLRPRNEGEKTKINEVVLKRRDTNMKHKAEQAKKITEEKKKRKRVNIDRVITPARLVKDSRTKKKDVNRLKRLDKGKKLKANSKTSKMLVVVRNSRHGGTAVTRRQIKDFDLLGKPEFSLMFMPNTEENLKNLKVVDPFVWYGFPSLKVVNDLLFKKATFKKDAASEAVVLSSNELIEECFGEHGIVCVEDLVHSVFENDDMFEKVAEKLGTIALGNFNTRKVEGFKIDAKKHLYGNLQHDINRHIAELI